MKLLNQSKIIVNKSKFFGYFFEINNSDNVDNAISFVRSKHPKSKHICCGAIYEQNEIFKNDGEVGNPGKILLEMLKQKKMQNNILIVARYFGGIKLGPAGVGKAFRECGNDLFQK